MDQMSSGTGRERDDIIATYQYSRKNKFMTDSERK